MSIKVFNAEASQPSLGATNAVNPTLPKLLLNYLRYYRTTYTAKTSIYSGTFVATLN